jgi:sulfur carrier protein ThiS
MIKVGDKNMPWHQGITVADLLSMLKDPYPYAVVRINERIVARPNFDKTFVPDQAEVFQIPMIAGG